MYSIEYLVFLFPQYKDSKKVSYMQIKKKESISALLTTINYEYETMLF